MTWNPLFLDFFPLQIRDRFLIGVSKLAAGHYEPVLLTGDSLHLGGGASQENTRYHQSYLILSCSFGSRDRGQTHSMPEYMYIHINFCDVCFCIIRIVEYIICVRACI